MKKEYDNRHLLEKAKPTTHYYEKGKGMFYKNNEGKTIFDLTSCNGNNSMACGVNVVKNVAKQLNTMPYSPGATDYALKCKISEKICINLNSSKILFLQDSDIIGENAIRIARKSFENEKNKYKVVVVEDINLDGSLPENIFLPKSITKAKYFELLNGGYIIIPYNDIATLKKCLSDKSVCAICLQTFNTATSFQKAGKDFLQAVKEFAKANNQLVIINEINTIGRINNFASFKSYNIQPDIICFGKELALGLPFGALCFTKDIYNNIKETDIFNQEYFNPLIASAVYESVNYLTAPKSDARFAELCKTFKQCLSSIQKFNTIVRNININGLVATIKINPLISSSTLLKFLYENGIYASVNKDLELVILPPINSTKADLKKAFSFIAKAFKLLNNTL